MSEAINAKQKEKYVGTLWDQSCKLELCALRLAAIGTQLDDTIALLHEKTPDDNSIEGLRILWHEWFTRERGTIKEIEAEISSVCKELNESKA